MPSVWDDWKDVAEAHGVDRKLFERRLWAYEPPWTYEAAATTPKSKGGRPKNTGRITEYDYQKAESLGVSRAALYYRVYDKGFSVERALRKI